MKPGPSDPAKVADYSDKMLRQEALRMANNCQLTGLPYIAAILERLANEG